MQVNNAAANPPAPATTAARCTKPTISLSGTGAARTVYVPQDLLEEVRKWVQESQRLKTLIHEVSQLSLALIKGHVPHQKRRRGRR